jgi:hypothetical protein
MHSMSSRSSKRYCRNSEHPLFPMCDGERWQNGHAPNSRQRVKAQFLEAYFQINLAYARLVALRKRHAPVVPKASERRLLREIERTLVAREKLEDFHARRGVSVRPVYREGFTIDLKFSDRESALPKAPPLIVSSASVRIAIPMPPGFSAYRAKTNT